MRSGCFLAAWISALIAGGPAFACRVHQPIRLDDVRHADVVAVGRITSYGLVRKPSILGGKRFGTLSDHARFEVEIDEFIVGQAARRLMVTWDNSTFDEPATPPDGPVLIALSGPGDGGSDPARPYTLFQKACSDPFLFEAAGDQARAVREILARGAHDGR